MDLENNILDYLNSNYNNDISINKLSKILKNNGFSGDYKNTYKKIISLENKNFLSTKLIGNSRIIKINYSNQAIISKIVIIELEKKIEFISKNPDFEKINNEIEEIKAKSIILSNKNIFSLNIIELLIITNNQIKAINKCKELEKKYDIRIDCLALNQKEFDQLINSTTIIQMLKNKIILKNQENTIKIITKSIQKITDKNYLLENLTESELRYNLSLFSYSEFGKETKSKKILLEELIIATLINGTARQKSALNQIIKDNDFSKTFLYFLSKKYSKEKEIIKITNKLNEIIGDNND